MISLEGIIEEMLLNYSEVLFEYVLMGIIIFLIGLLTVTGIIQKLFFNYTRAKSKRRFSKTIGISLLIIGAILMINPALEVLFDWYRSFYAMLILFPIVISLFATGIGNFDWFSNI